MAVTGWTGHLGLGWVEEQGSGDARMSVGQAYRERRYLHGVGDVKDRGWCKNLSGGVEKSCRGIILTIGKTKQEGTQLPSSPSVHVHRWLCRAGLPLVLCSPGRRCALVALGDVKTYLTEESGQIAVSLSCLFPPGALPLQPPGPAAPPWSRLAGIHPPHSTPMGSLPRCLTPQIPLGSEGT